MSYLEKNLLTIFGLIFTLYPNLALALSPQGAVILFVLILLGDYLISTSNCHSNDDSNNQI